MGDEAFCRDKLQEHQERYGLDSLIAWQNFGSLSHLLPAPLHEQT